MNKQSSTGRWKKWLRILGPLLFLFIVFRIVDLGQVTELLKEIRVGSFLASMAIFPVLIGLRTLRLWIIARHLKIRISYFEFFKIYYLSWFLGAIPVSGLAVIFMLAYLEEKEGSTQKAAVSIVIDRIMDIMGHILFLFFGLFFLPKGIIKNSLSVFLYIGLIFLILVLIFRQKVWQKFVSFSQKHFRKSIRERIAGLDKEISLFWSNFGTGSLAIIITVSLVLGLIRSLVLYLLALSLSIPVSFGLMVGCRALIGLVNVIPITINGLGTRDAVLLSILPLTGVSAESALALSFTAFLWDVCFNFSGIPLWIKKPLPLEGIRSLKRKLMSRQAG